MGVLASGIPGSVIKGQRLTSKDVMLESTTSKVLVVFEGHAEDDENSNWTTNFFYPPRSHTIPKSGLIFSYFPDWLIIRWFHFLHLCLFSLVWLYLLLKCISLTPVLVNSNLSPNYIQFNSLYQYLNTAHWKARLSRLAQTNLSNLQTCVNHSIVLHNFQYPFNPLGMTLPN